nr:MAG TPA: hypothetical protein [Caudoviricetes sp.]DAS01224.1 MAG TPA: hypothetical protein [Caudoviricetes sp.]
MFLSQHIYIGSLVFHLAWCPLGMAKDEIGRPPAVRRIKSQRCKRHGGAYF